MQMMNDNKEMTAEQCRKDSFVRHELRELLQAIDRDITDVSYSVEENGEEFALITWQNGYKRRINVSGDSLRALVWDTLRRI